MPTIEADCDFTVEKAREILKGTSPKVYLGFDDGPGHGSKDVVAALNKNNVQVRDLLIIICTRSKNLQLKLR